MRPRVLTNRGLLARLAGASLILGILGGCDKPSPPPSAPQPAPPASVPQPQPAISGVFVDDGPAWPEGKGVQCGKERCLESEVCCFGGGNVPPEVRYQCLPADAADDCAFTSVDASVVRCDDATDCGAGERCCWILEDSANRTECLAKSCEIEICARGGRCSTPRNACVSDDAAPSGGRCASNTMAGPRCGNTACGGDKPWCVWQGGQAQCVPRGAVARELPPDTHLLECTSSKGCPEGEACCLASGRAFCKAAGSFTCVSAHGGQVVSHVLCERLEDCLALPSRLAPGQRWECTKTKTDAPYSMCVIR